MLNVDIVEYLISHIDEYKRQLSLLRTQFFSMSVEKFEFVDVFLQTVEIDIGRQFLVWLLSAQRNYVGLLRKCKEISRASKDKQYAMILRNCLDKTPKSLNIPRALLGLLAVDKDLNTILQRFEIDENDFVRLIVQGGLKFRNPQIANDVSPLSKIVYDRGAYMFDAVKWRDMKKLSASKSDKAK